jgi:hypothetical protein
MAAKALRRLWKHVHPDLFVRHPEAQAANERSMQSLRALLDAAEECQKALRSGGAVPAVQPRAQRLSFYVHPREEEEEEEAEKGGALREISVAWRPPSPLLTSAQRSSTASAELWRLSADGCVATLLSQISPEHAMPLEEDAPEASQGELEAAENLVHTAAAAANRCRGATSQSSSPSDQKPPPPLPGGGTLQRKMLFFHAVAESERPAATEWLAALVHEVLPAGATHGPILVCGGPPPPTAVGRGFACVRLDANGEALRQSLWRARVSAGGAETALRRAEAAGMLGAARQLRIALGCEAVRTREAPRSSEKLREAPRRGIGGAGAGTSGVGVSGGGSSPVAAAAWLGMYEELLVHAAGLRSALDGPWTGLHLVLESPDDDARDDAFEGDDGGGARAATPAAVALGDASCGGGTLVVSGLAGASGALAFVRREWRVIGQCQRRYALSEALRERLGCAAVECHGAPAATDAQVDSLRGLLTLLRGVPRLLPQEEFLADVAISIGEVGKGGLLAGAAGATGVAGTARRAGGSARHLELRLPSRFDANDAFVWLTQAAERRTAQPQHAARQRRRRR